MDPKTTPDHPGLDALASQAEQATIGATDLDAAGIPAGQPTQQDDEGQRKLEAMAASVLVGLLKLARQAIAKRLPEIREEWTDDKLDAPAQAAIPLMRKHMAKLMELAGSNPELALFVISCVPLGMGFMTAMDRAAEREKLEAKAKAAAAGPAAADQPAPPILDGGAGE